HAGGGLGTLRGGVGDRYRPQLAGRRELAVEDIAGRVEVVAVADGRAVAGPGESDVAGGVHGRRYGPVGGHLNHRPGGRTGRGIDLSIGREARVVVRPGLHELAGAVHRQRPKTHEYPALDHSDLGAVGPAGGGVALEVDEGAVVGAVSAPRDDVV